MAAISLAAITFLASQVPDFAPGVPGAEIKQYAVVAGAVTGGGLTVIANAPNPAGQSLLSRYFGGGISPAKLLVSALILLETKSTSPLNILSL